MQLSDTAAMRQYAALKAREAEVTYYLDCRRLMGGSLPLELELRGIQFALLRRDWAADARSQAGQRLGKTHKAVVPGLRVELNGGPRGLAIKPRSQEGKKAESKKARPVVVKGHHNSRRNGGCQKVRRVATLAAIVAQEVGRLRHERKVAAAQAMCEAWDIDAGMAAGVERDARKKVRAGAARARHAGRRDPQTSFEGEVLALVWRTRKRLSRGQMRLAAAAISEAVR